MESKFKVGDFVTIKERIGSDTDYRFGFTGGMAAMSGMQFKITAVEPAFTGPGQKFPDDGFRYELSGSIYNWASSMFKDSDSYVSADSCSSMHGNSDNNSIEAFIRRKKCPELDFNL